MTTEVTAFSNGAVYVATSNESAQFQAYEAAFGGHVWTVAWPAERCNTEDNYAHFPDCNFVHQNLNEVRLRGDIGDASLQALIFFAPLAGAYIIRASDGWYIFDSGRNNGECPLLPSRVVMRNDLFYDTWAPYSCREHAGWNDPCPPVQSCDPMLTVIIQGWKFAAQAAGCGDHDDGWGVMPVFNCYHSRSAGFEYSLIEDGGPVLTTPGYMLCIRYDRLGLAARAYTAGPVLWTRPALELGELTPDGLAVGDGRIVVLGKAAGRLAVLDEADGSVLLSVSLTMCGYPITPTSGVTLAGDAILFGDSLGFLHVYDAKTLVRLQSIRVARDALVGDVAVTEAGIYVNSSSGTLVRLDLGGPPSDPNAECPLMVEACGLPVNGSQALGPGHVNTFSGNVVFGVEDLRIPTAGLPLAFVRTYNTQRCETVDELAAAGLPGFTVDSALGDGWTHNWQQTVRPVFNIFTGGTLYVEDRADGSRVVFSMSVDGTITNTPGIVDDFSVVTAPSVFSATYTGNGAVVRRKDGMTWGYDTDGLLWRIRDRNGNRQELGYELFTPVFGEPSKARVTTVTYFSSTLTGGSVIAPEFRLSVTLTYESGTGRLHSLVAPAPSGYGEIATVYAYGTGNQLESVHGPGPIYDAEYTYDISGRMATLKEPRAPLGEKRFGYDYNPTDGRVMAVKSGIMEPIASYWYFQVGLTGATTGQETIISQAAQVPRVTHHLYDERKNLFRIVQGYGAAVTEQAWNDRRFLISVRDPNGGTASLYRDSKGNVTAYVDAEHRVETAVFEPVYSQPVSRVDANGGVSGAAYDEAGNPTVSSRVLEPLLGDPGGIVSTTNWFDNRGLAVREADALGRETHRAYDGMGNVVSTTSFLSAGSGVVAVSTHAEYDALGRRTASIDARGVRTVYQYDAEGRLVTTAYGITGLGPIPAWTANTYDNLNRVVQVTEGTGRYTQTVYKPGWDLVATVGNNDGVTAVNVYDMASELLWTVDGNGKKTSYVYDYLGRLVNVVDAMGGMVTIGYDLGGNVTSVTDPNSHATGYEYDLTNRRTKVTHADGHMRSFGYDAVGNMTSQTDEGGAVTTWTYDTLGRLRRTEWSGGVTPQVDMHYDLAGNRVRAETSVAMAVGGMGYRTDTAYDSLNREETEAVSIGGTPRVSKTYARDLAGNVLGLTVHPYAGDTGDHVLEYSYDSLTRLLSVTANGQPVYFTYSPVGCGSCGAGNGPVLIQRPNGVDTHLDYDMLGRVTGISHIALAGGTPVNYDQYSYDIMGNRMTHRDVTGLWSYGYDSLYRLTSVQHPVFADQTFTYDHAGNRLSLVDEYAGTTESTGEQISVTNELLGWTNAVLGQTASYAWNPVGTLASRTVNDSTTQYLWDGAERMVTVVTPAGTRTFGYDSSGERVMEQDGSGPAKWFVYEGLNVVMELDASFQPTVVHVPGISQTRLRSDEGEVLPVPFTEYSLHDGLGSVVALTDAWGNLTQEYMYEAFGAVQYGATDPFHRNRFVGLQQDDFSSLTYMNARWYDPAVGRFLSRDPEEDGGLNGQGLNLYPYAGNNPMAFVDPTGRSRVLVCLRDFGTDGLGMLHLFDDAEKEVFSAEIISGGKKTPIGEFKLGNWKPDPTSDEWGPATKKAWDSETNPNNAYGPYFVSILGEGGESTTRGIHGSSGLSDNRRKFREARGGRVLSHGCIRMANPDIIELHDRLRKPEGTPVEIKATCGAE